MKNAEKYGELSFSQRVLCELCVPFSELQMMKRLE